MSARDDILARVRSALTDIDTQPKSSPPIGELHSSQGSFSRFSEVRERGRGRGRGEVGTATLELFAETVADYRATVIRAQAGDVAATIVEALRAADRRSLVVPTGLDASWQAALGEAFSVLPESEAHSPQVLDGIDAVVTACALGIAVTGTIILDHSRNQGRRELTLVPDTHLCVIRADQVLHDVPEAVTRLASTPHKGQPLTWISGPSATSDIELQRVEGVHGPRTLIVVLVGSAD